MEKSIRNPMIYWGSVAMIFLILFWMLSDAILPFLISGAVAYCLDPVADRLETLGFSRIWATVTITLVAIVAFVLGTLLVIPVLIEQLIGLMETLPKLFSDLRDFLISKFPDLLDGESSLSQSLTSVAVNMQSKIGDVLNGVLSSAAGLLNVALLVFLVPVITFYLLMDWDRMIAQIDKLLPRKQAPMLRELALEINKTLAAFIRGQGLVGLILGTFYAGALMLVGLNFGLIVGAVAGLVTFIPYVGALVGGVLAIGLAIYQFWGEWIWVGAVAGIFVFGQFVEGNILTPKLVGGSVGLHPVWLIFALSAFGSMFGFVGLLVAVPVAASIGVITRFGLARYKESSLYLGDEDLKED